MPLFFELLIAAVLTVGASARLTRLIGADTITAPLRAKLTTWSKSTKPAEFLACPWCSGFWTSAGVVYAVWLVQGWPFSEPSWGLGAAALTLGSSYLVGLMAEFEEA